MKTGQFLFFLLIILFSCKENEKKTTEANLAITGDEFIDRLTMELDKDPLNAALRFQRAEKLYAKQMYDECLEDLRVAITTDSLQATFYHLAADAFLDNNLSNRALQSMQKAAALFPTRIPTLLKLSEIQLILKMNDASITTLNEIIKQDPQNAEAYFMLGANLKDMGQLDRAINAFQTATEFDAKLIDAWISLGNIFEMKKDKAAKGFYENAINIDPKNSTAKHALAYFYQNQGDVQRALDIYKEITLQDPAYVDAYFNTGIIFLEKNELDKAYENFNIMIGIDPKDWMGYHYRGIINYERKKYAEAMADFRSSTNLNPNNKKGLDLLEDCKKKLEN